jgi:uracil-DNA glycosylase
MTSMNPPMSHYEAKRLVNEYLHRDGLVASHASRHRDAWVVAYVDAARPDEMLDGGALIVTADGTVLPVSSVPGDIDWVLDDYALANGGEDPDLPWDEAQELRGLLAARDPWPGVVREPSDELDRVSALRRQGRTVYPKAGLELAALAVVPFQRVRVVIVGRDPYPGEGLATGMAFAVPNGTRRLPDSLQSIHKALENDEYAPPANSDLSGWARQGVLLLNRAPTFEVGIKPKTHLPIWSKWTNEVITALNERAEPVVFVLWGGYAKAVERLIDQEQHTVITAYHPAALRAVHREAFQREGTFRKVNEALAEPIDWSA